MEVEIGLWEYFLICQSRNFQFPQISWQERFSVKFLARTGVLEKCPGSGANTATIFVHPWLLPEFPIFLFGSSSKAKVTQFYRDKRLPHEATVMRIPQLCCLNEAALFRLHWLLMNNEAFSISIYKGGLKPSNILEFQSGRIVHQRVKFDSSKSKTRKKPKVKKENFTRKGRKL